jgi:hypothetical protein
MSNHQPNEDWRRQGQERYLKGKRLRYCRYTPPSERWDHDHCAFCFTKISVFPGDINEGYCTEDGYHWICKDCFEDFNKEFEWVVVSD